MKIYKRIAGLFFAALAVVMLLPAWARAEGGCIDLSHTCTLTASCQEEGIALSDAEFSLYQAASVDAYGRLTPTETFSKYHVQIPAEDEAGWKTLATTLEGCVLRDNITPEDSGITDEQGKLAFPSGGKTLLPGLYLLLGSRNSQDGMIYEIQPTMVMLPVLNEENGTWDYDITVEPKYESHPDTPKGITRKVLKVWKDAGHEQNRPKEITVQLLKDGKVHDTVTLNAGNNWRHTWEGLDASGQWTVAEKEPDGYTVSVTREGITFVVTNTWDEPGDPPGGPSEPGKPSQKLPQTGQLWWPAALLLCMGILFIVAGLIRRRGVSDEEK